MKGRGIEIPMKVIIGIVIVVTVVGLALGIFLLYLLIRWLLGF